MRILLLTAGSRGDVDPFVALAQHAAARGHEVRLGVTREFTEQVRAVGLDAAPLDGSFADLIARQGVSPWAAYRSFRTRDPPDDGRGPALGSGRGRGLPPGRRRPPPQGALRAARRRAAGCSARARGDRADGHPDPRVPGGGGDHGGPRPVQPAHLPGLRSGQRDAPRAVARDPVVARPARPGRRARPGEHAGPRQPGPAGPSGRLARHHRADRAVAARPGGGARRPRARPVPRRRRRALRRVRLDGRRRPRRAGPGRRRGGAGGRPAGAGGDRLGRPRAARGVLGRRCARPPGGTARQRAAAVCGRGAPRRRGHGARGGAGGCAVGDGAVSRRPALLGRPPAPARPRGATRARPAAHRRPAPGRAGVAAAAGARRGRRGGHGGRGRLRRRPAGLEQCR